jgi:hypothetical protein
MENLTNDELFNEMKQRGFFVSKVQQETSAGIDYLVVSAEPVKVREVYYSDRKDWSVNYGDGHE